MQTENTLLLELEASNGKLNKKRLLEYKLDSSSEKEEQPQSQVCKMCNLEKSKYSCPKCKLKTCSVNCIKNHKSLFKCNGLLNRSYTSKLDSNQDLFKDVKYLTSMINQKNASSKKTFFLINPIQNTENTEEISQNQENSQKNSDFQEENCRSRLKTKALTLKNLSKLSSKFRNVTFLKSPSFINDYSQVNSYCDSKNKRFYWSFKFYFLDLYDDSSHSFQSFICKKPFDDMIFSINSISKYLFELFSSGDIEILTKADNKLLSYMNSNRLDGFSKKFDVFLRISKIEYENLLLKRSECLKVNDFLYFKPLSEKDRSDLVVNVINGWTIRNFIEIYIK